MATNNSTDYPILDEDDMTSDSATSLATQQSIKAYVDAEDKLELIGTATASSSSTIDFTGLTSSYSMYMLVFDDLAPASDQTYLYMRTSSNGGSSYDNGTSDYAWCNDTAGTSHDQDDSDSEIHLNGSVANENRLGSGANETFSGQIYIFNPGDSEHTRIRSFLVGVGNTGATQMLYGASSRKSTSAVDAFRLYISSGNLATGNFKLYGLKAT